VFAEPARLFRRHDGVGADGGHQANVLAPAALFGVFHDSLQDRPVGGWLAAAVESDVHQRPGVLQRIGEEEVGRGASDLQRQNRALGEGLTVAILALEVAPFAQQQHGAPWFGLSSVTTLGRAVGHAVDHAHGCQAGEDFPVVGILRRDGILARRGDDLRGRRIDPTHQRFEGEIGEQIGPQIWIPQQMTLGGDAEGIGYPSHDNTPLPG